MKVSAIIIHLTCDDSLFTLWHECALETNEEQLASPPHCLFRCGTLLLRPGWDSCAALCSHGWVVLFSLFTKVDANNMIPKTSLVHSSCLQTTKFVNGWFDVTANNTKQIWGGGTNYVSISILALAELGKWCHEEIWNTEKGTDWERGE